MQKKKIAVIGIGQFGRAIASTLAATNTEVLAIDSNQSIINSIAEEVAFSVVLDATDTKALLSQNILDFEAVIVTIGNFESRLLCASILIELGIKRIIVRAIGKNQQSIIERIGIKEILSPEVELGAIVAERLTNPNVISYMKLPDGFRIAEVLIPKSLAYKSLKEISLFERYHLNLITIKNEVEITKRDKVYNEEHLLIEPNLQTIILPTDSLILFGLARSIEKFINLNQ